MTTTSATTSTGPKGFRWLYLILGIVLFVFGVGIIRHPVASYFGLAMYFSIVIIVMATYFDSCRIEFEESGSVIW